jgi:hypothetical protein
MFRRTLAFAAGAALVLAGALAVQPAVATEIGPQGGPTAECRSAGYDYGIKLDTGDPGDYSYDDDGPWTVPGADIELFVTIYDDNTFEWWGADPPVAAVLVKAGTGYTILPGGTSGEGTPSNGKGISHITFCYDEPQNEPEEHLTVTKTVETSWHRTHNWSLDKSVDTNDVYLYVPGQGEPTSATVHWTVDVSYDGYTDGDFMVWGDITVLNDGDTTVIVDDVTDVITVDVTDTSVMVDCGVDLATMNVTLLPGESLECTYSTEVDSAIDGYNTASAITTTGDTYESLPVDITWTAEPTTETDKSVTVTDVSDLLGEQEDTFTAPNGGSLTYEHTFTWEWYHENSEPDCGDFSYPNLATLVGEDSGFIDDDTETVNVHVQCYVFQGETAWAANTGPGTLPYNTKGGNWATYVQYPKGGAATSVYNVYAGQNMYVGTATITPIGGGNVTVTVDLIAGWEYNEVASNLKIQTYASAPKGNPSPGLFAYKTTCTTDPCTSGPIPVANYYGIHVDVGKWVPDPAFP